MSAPYQKSWRELAAAPSERIDLAEAALMIAAEEYQGLDVRAYVQRIDDMASTLRQRLRADISPTDKIRALNLYFFDELGYAGNSDDYYDPRNSYLNDVIERRLGIPITLSVLYIEIGRRLGLKLNGVSFPGHFLVKCSLRDGAVVLDPYAKGISIGIKDLQQRLSTFAGGAKLPPETVMTMLASADPREILARMLRNLKGIYLERADHARALSAADRIVTLMPGAAEEVRDRGVIYEKLDCFRAALADLEAYLKLKPDADDARIVRERLVELRRRASRLN